MSASTIEEGRWRELRARLGAFVGRRVGNPADSEDVVQDVFVRMQRNLGALSSTERLDAWAFRITRNAIVDYYRAPQRRESSGKGTAKIMDELASDPIGDEPSTDARAEMAQCCIAPMVGQLPDDYRQAIELTELEGMTQSAAAERLGLSVPGMKSRVQRGRARLQAMLVRCCQIETDRRGGVVAFEPREGEGCAAYGDQQHEPVWVALGRFHERPRTDERVDHRP
jgi:RNA polymerase sigma-70 factor, ECF subfamily